MYEKSKIFWKQKSFKYFFDLLLIEFKNQFYEILGNLLSFARHQSEYLSDPYWIKMMLNSLNH